LPTPVPPSSPKIGNRRYEVKVQRHTSRATMGEVNYTYGFIRSATHSTRTGRKFRRAEVHDTFWHEVTHGILWEMGHRLYQNEKFVGQFANLLNRAIESARFERREGGSVKRLEGGAR
jgi:hypothetical protein